MFAPDAIDELDEERAFAERALRRMRRGDVAEAACEHDRLVVSAHLACEFLLVRAEISGEVGSSELVVEGRSADRAVDHDVERGGNARRLAVIALPRLARPGNVQVRHAEAREPRLRLRADARRALVANLAAGTRARSRMRRDGGRVVVRLDLHEDVREAALVAPRARAIREEALDFGALHDRGVVGIGDHRAARIEPIRVADHREERLVHRAPVDRPRRIEDLVAAVLGIGLREHHQLDVARIAAELREVVQ
jgi:hypothetical protein